MHIFSGANEIAQYLRTDRKRGDVLLFKAGRNTHLEGVIRYVYHDQGLQRVSESAEK